MKITACSIVKNEEKNIAISIDSYKDVVDEIIIVDTGSTDNTVEICKSLGAKTLFYKWDNDFSAAKNYALDHATGDWVIFLDADEWFEPKLNKNQFRNILKNINNKYDALIVEMREFDIVKNKVLSNEVTMRIFKNDPGIRYRGRIHEVLKKDGSELKLARILDLVIFHSGYSSNILTHKAKRNLDILNNLYAQGNADTSILFYMFRENYLLNKEDAIEYFHLFMKQPDIEKTIQKNTVIICIYELMYKLMISMPDRFSREDIDGLLKTAYDKYPEIPMHSYLIGCEYIKQKKFDEAINWINKALKLNSSYTNHMSNSFAACEGEAYYNLGCIYQEINKADEALTFFIKASKGSNNDVLLSVISKVIDIIKYQPQEEIILFLDSIFDIRRKEIIESILKTLKKTRLHKVFIYYAVKYNQDFDGQDETTYIAMILVGQAELAVATAVEASNNFIEYNFIRDSKKDNVNVNQSEDQTDTYNDWHLTYAVIAVIYSKNYSLYEKYKYSFRPEQRAIIDVYLNGAVIDNLTNDIYLEFNKLYNAAFNVLSESELYQLKEKVIGK